MYWTVHLEGGPRRVNHAAVVVSENIFTFGGYCTGGNYKERKPIDIHVLNTSSYRWVRLATPEDEEQLHCMPYQRYGHTAVVYADKIFIWGGRNDESACNTLFCFDTRTQLWSCPTVKGNIPGARDGHSACVIGHSMYIFGGFEEYGDRFSQDVHVLNFRTMEWKFLYTQGDPPTYRDFHSATAIGSRMYIFGGRGDLNGPFHSEAEIYCPDIMYLDTETATWVRPETFGRIPVGRRSHSAFIHGEHLYIFGGYNSVLDIHFNDLHRFSPVKNEWELIHPRGIPPSPRRRQSCLVIEDKLFLFGGTSPFPSLPSGTPPDGLMTKLIDHNDLHVLDFEPTLKTLSMLAVITNQIDIQCLPVDLKWEFAVMTTDNVISNDVVLVHMDT